MEKYQIVKKGNGNNAMVHGFQQVLSKCRKTNLIKLSAGIVILVILSRNHFSH